MVLLTTTYYLLLSLPHPIRIILTHLAVHRLHAVYPFLIQVAIAIDVGVHELLTH